MTGVVSCRLAVGIIVHCRLNVGINFSYFVRVLILSLLVISSFVKSPISLPITMKIDEKSETDKGI